MPTTPRAVAELQQLIETLEWAAHAGLTQRHNIELTPEWRAAQHLKTLLAPAGEGDRVADLESQLSGARAAGREEAAKACDELSKEWMSGSPAEHACANAQRLCAMRIRSLPSSAPAVVEK